MKKIIFVVIIVVIGISVALYASLRKYSTDVPGPVVTQTPTISITPATTPFCFAKNVTTSIDTEGAAGSMYIKLRIKNNAAVDCQIQADSVIEVNVQDHPKNVTSLPQSTPEHSVLLLSPQAEAYAQLRVPNGPQCTAPVTRDVHIRYRISPDDTVQFNSDTKTSIQTCTDEKEVTKIDIWPWSLQPITQ